MDKEQQKAIEKAILDKATQTTCEFIIAELESIREEINAFIDKLIEEKIKNYNN